MVLNCALHPSVGGGCFVAVWHPPLRCSAASATCWPDAAHILTGSRLWLPAGYLMASVAFTAAVLQWMVFKVAAARKAAGVKYPAMTSDDSTPEAAAFNCTQRV